MIAVDTNILIRYAVKDDRQQTVAATKILAENRCMILETVLLEVAWVLESARGYRLSRADTVGRIRHILGLPGIVVPDVDRIAQAVSWFEAGMDFADALHLAGSDNLDAFATFDQELVRVAVALDVPVKFLSLD